MINTGVYISNNNSGYWKASDEQTTAINNFPSWKYNGMGSSHFLSSAHAEEVVKGIRNKYTIIIDTNGNMWIKTSDGEFRQVLIIEKPIKPPF